MKAVVTGATGFVGQKLIKTLDNSIVLTRNVDKARRIFGDAVEIVEWDMTGPAPASAFEGADAVFHLAGESVAEGRWTAAKKARIMSSREDGTRRLIEGLAEVKDRPAVLVSASAVGWYGDRGDATLTESSEPAETWLAEVCKVWEREAGKARELDMRVVSLRIGIVLGEGGGALGKMLFPFKMGLGGRLGDGKQYMPWVHVDDIVGLCHHAARHETLDESINATAPAPVTNREFTKTLGSVLGRPTIFPVPGFALSLALGEFSTVLLSSQRVLPERTRESGYEFHHPELKGALESIIQGSPAAKNEAREAEAVSS